MSKGLESTIDDCEVNRSARVGGVILTTILHEDSLLYLCAAMKRHGLFKQFENVVAGFCHLETVFKKRNICRKVFSLRYLDRYLQSVGVACTGEYGNLESERSEVLARVGYEALNHIMVKFIIFALVHEHFLLVEKVENKTNKLFKRYKAMNIRLI